MASKITYTNKVARNVSTEDDQYKVTASDMNEIKEVVNETVDNIEVSATEFTESVTFNEEYANVSFWKKNRLVVISFQGANKTHSQGDILFTVPEGYRPSKSQVFTPFTKNINAYGQVLINSSGVCSVNQISSNSVSGRIYFELMYFV